MQQIKMEDPEPRRIDGPTSRGTIVTKAPIGDEDCVDCRGTGWKQVTRDGVDGVIRCECVRARRLAAKRFTEFGSEFVVGASIDLLESRPKKYGKAFGDRFAKKRGGVIVGDVGRGKTWMASAIVNDLYSRGLLRSCIYANVPVLIQEVQKTFRPGRVDPGIQDKLVDCDLLVLDDLGAERTTEWTEFFLYTIVNMRHGNESPILAVTNETLENLETKIGLRTMDRLMGSAGGDAFLFTGASRRWSK